jgi:CheY-like chemotaxis protein
MSSTSGDILVVDDQPVNVRLLATMLSQLGYKVRKATSGEMALTAIHAEPPDLILMDITMPQMDGYELCEILKKDPKTADIPIIFVSALDESMDKTKAFEVGAVDYVAKPFQWVEVQARVKTQLALRALQQQPSAGSDIETQAALWAPAMPEMAHFSLTTQPPSHAILELLDGQLAAPGLLQLTLACSGLSSPSSTVSLATVRGIFRGLSSEKNTVDERFHRAQALIEADFQSVQPLQLLHAVLNASNRTFTYRAQGYTLALVRKQTVVAQATAAEIGLELGDRLVVLSNDLSSVQLTNILINSGSNDKVLPSSNIPQQIAAKLRLTTGYQGSVTVVDLVN